MSKYIDRSKVNDEIVRVLEHTDCKGEYIDRVLRAIESLPTIDIVRCKDCKYWKSEHICIGRWGWYGTMMTEADAFCSYGERIDNE